MELLNPLADAAFPSRTITYTGTAGVTATWPAGPEGVLVTATSDAYILVGEGVTATTANGTMLPANTPVPFKVPLSVSGAWRVSAIQVSGAGSIYCKPINRE